MRIFSNDALVDVETKQPDIALTGRENVVQAEYNEIPEFDEISISIKNFKFNREEANER